MEYKALPFSSVWENGIFNLPTKLVDEYLKLASEYQLKALLYIFRNNGQASTNAVAKALGQTVNDTDNLLERNNFCPYPITKRYSHRFA